MGENIAKELIAPLTTDLIFRVVFLYVGQGESTLLAIPKDQGSYDYMLIDSNLDQERGGIYLPDLIADLIPEEGVLSYYVNTHPHTDHIKGLSEINKKRRIAEIWHSGHKPSKKHVDAYKELEEAIKKVRKEGGKVVELLGTRTTTNMGLIEFNTLAPAAHVVEDIEDETPEQRDERIHEQCAVLRFSYGSETEKCRVLITGDADKKAWRDHITKYHGQRGENRLQSQILSAPHHGSRSPFKETEDDREPYVTQLGLIDPAYVIISAPQRKDSPHGHPHEDALKIYLTQIKDTNKILHTGEKRFSFILTVYADGSYSLEDDSGQLAKNYRFPTDNNGGKKGAAVTVITSTKSTRMG